MKSKLLLGFCIFIFLLPGIFALGVSPGKATADYIAGGQKVVQVDVYNNQQQDFIATLEVTGALKDYIVLSTDKLEFKANEQVKTFTYTLMMPADFRVPGTHTSEITIKESKELKTDSQINIDTNVIVKTKIQMKVPYDGMYLDAEMQIDDFEPGHDLDIFLSLYNLGSEDIKSVSAKLDIYDAQDNFIDSIVAGPKPLKSKTMGELILKKSTEDLAPGAYRVKATIFYDNQQLELYGTFTGEGFMLKLYSIGVDDFTLGGIARFNVIVKNIGNNVVTGFESAFKIYDERNEIIGSFRSNSIDVQSQQLGEVVAYWDTKDIEEGDYEGSLLLSYDGDSERKDIMTTIGKDSIDVSLNRLTGKVVTEEQQEAPAQGDMAFQQASFNTILLVLIFIALLVAIVVMVKMMKKS